MEGTPTAAESGRIKTTDRSGNYSFKRLDMTQCNIRVRATNFDTIEMPVFLVKGKLKEKVDFAMSPSVIVPVSEHA